MPGTFGGDALSGLKNKGKSNDPLIAGGNEQRFSELDKARLSLAEDASFKQERVSEINENE